jgi:hypothetical protein
VVSGLGIPREQADPADRLEVFLHCCCRSGGVLRSNGLGDTPVLSQGLRWAVQLLERLVSAFGDSLTDSLHEIREESAASGRGHGGVELAVSIFAQFAVVDLGAHDLERSFDSGEIVVGASQGGQFGELCFDCFAGVEHVGQPAAAIDEGGQRFRVQGAGTQIDTASVPAFDQALNFEHNDGLFDGGAAYL